jgi:hypothetical protein
MPACVHVVDLILVLVWQTAGSLSSSTVGACTVRNSELLKAFLQLSGYQPPAGSAPLERDGKTKGTPPSSASAYCSHFAPMLLALTSFVQP